ncbi:MAG: hypothetical protein KGH49_02625 [Candidatus Micrarchaeota archaeon]|nr:hypothetical protein [Candidatus Micrarchaeota archaeon]
MALSNDDIGRIIEGKPIVSDAAPDPGSMMPLNKGYDKIGMMVFVFLSIDGFLLPVFLGIIFSLLGDDQLIGITFLVFAVACLISYLKVRKSEDKTIYTYIFILTAPSTVSELIALFIPTFGIIAGFAGIFASYFVLQGRGLI